MSTINPLSEFKDWKFYFFQGLLFLILGGLALAVPQYVSITIALLLGWLLLFGGIFQLIMAFKSDDSGAFFLTIISAIVLMIVGLVLISRPIPSVITLTMIFSAYLFIHGFVQVFTAFALKPLKNWGWLLLSGIVAIILALVIWSNFPFNVTPFLGILIGIYFLFWGIAEIMLSFSVKGLKKQV